mgnify:CR=1 FL=1
MRAHLIPVLWSNKSNTLERSPCVSAIDSTKLVDVKAAFPVLLENLDCLFRTNFEGFRCRLTKIHDFAVFAGHYTLNKNDLK